MIVVLIRSLRPYLPLIGFLSWFVARIFLSEYNELNLLEELLLGMNNLKDHSLHLVWGSSFSFATPIASLAWHAMEDWMAFVLVSTVLQICYNLYHLSLKSWMDSATDSIFHWSLDHVPGVETQFDKVALDLLEKDDSMKKFFEKDDNAKVNHALPKKGWGPKAVLEELAPYADKENSKWQQGKLSGTVYQDDAAHTQLMNDAFQLYTWSNPLHLGQWPKLNQCGAEVIAMCSKILHAPQPYGCITSGGTESIICAIKASWIYYGKRRGIRHPELICGTSAHAAVDKACELLGIRQIRVDCSAGDFTLSPASVKSLITSNTIMIYASAPTYPQGVVDPIAELSNIALQYDIGFHVDACLGGFVLAFCDNWAGTFDFKCAGVTSMSIDTHKYGYAAKGTSVVVYRQKKLRHAQYFCYSKWTGGIYATPTLAGSRPGALEVCAWAALMSLGEDGYKNRASTITKACQQMATGVSRIDGLHVMTKNPSMVVCFGSDELDIYAIGSRMSRKGWVLNELQSPASIHICVTLNVVRKAEVFVKELKDAVEEERIESKGNKKQGSAGVYGMTGGIPKGPINNILKEVIDRNYAP